MTEIQFKHEPVLLHEVLAWLDPAAGGVFADGTLGGGGHSERILQRIGDSGVSTASTGTRTPCAPPRQGWAAIRAFGRFTAIFTISIPCLPAGVLLDGGLLDLGVSSYQLDNPAARLFLS